jgi:hypothetical protein
MMENMNNIHLIIIYFQMKVDLMVVNVSDMS